MAGLAKQPLPSAATSQLAPMQVDNPQEQRTETTQQRASAVIKPEVEAQPHVQQPKPSGVQPPKPSGTSGEVKVEGANPRKNRLQRCSTCGQCGHKARTCKAPPSMRLALANAKMTKLQRCSACGGRGHKIRTCRLFGLLSLDSDIWAGTVDEIFDMPAQHDTKNKENPHAPHAQPSAPQAPKMRRGSISSITDPAELTAVVSELLESVMETPAELQKLGSVGDMLLPELPEQLAAAC